MNVTIGDLVIWLIVGGFAGSIVGAIAKRSKQGYGRWKNLAIGLAGAVIGGGLAKLLPFDLGLGRLAITFEDLLAAIVGAFLLLLIIRIIRAKWGGKTSD